MWVMQQMQQMQLEANSFPLLRALLYQRHPGQGSHG